MNPQPPVIYQRTQFGTMIVAGTLVAVALPLLVGLGRPKGERSRASIVSTMLLSTAGPAVAAVAFSTLTIRVDADAVSWWFTLPSIGGRIALGDIAHVEPGKRFFWNYGLRSGCNGTLYNVSGRGYVRIEHRGGWTVMLGSPEPERLVAAIGAASAAARAVPPGTGSG